MDREPPNRARLGPNFRPSFPPGSGFYPNKACLSQIGNVYPGLMDRQAELLPSFLASREATRSPAAYIAPTARAL